MTKTNPLRRLTREHPEIEAFFEAHKEIHFGSDRAAGILAAAALEHYLEAMIVLHLPNNDASTVGKLRGHGGALSSFYNNIQLAYAMDLIDKVARDDLEVIRNIRNVFAHAMGHVSFSTSEIRNRSSKLKSEAEYSRPMLDTEQMAAADRRRYIAVANHIGHQLLYKAAEKLDDDEVIE